MPLAERNARADFLGGLAASAFPKLFLAGACQRDVAYLPLMINPVSRDAILNFRTQRFGDFLGRNPFQKGKEKEDAVHAPDLRRPTPRGFCHPRWLTATSSSCVNHREPLTAGLLKRIV